MREALGPWLEQVDGSPEMGVPLLRAWVPSDTIPPPTVLPCHLFCSLCAPSSATYKVRGKPNHLESIFSQG